MIYLFSDAQLNQDEFYEETYQNSVLHGRVLRQIRYISCIYYFITLNYIQLKIVKCEFCVQITYCILYQMFVIFRFDLGKL